MRSKGILMIVTIAIIGCDDANGGGNTTTPRIHSKIVAPVVEKQEEVTTHNVDWTYVELELDELTFQEAFRLEHMAKGEGQTFWWRGDHYTTNLRPVGMISDIRTVGRTTWVLNSDDKDDYCLSNIFDECGTCNGDGRHTWFIDRDGDGLGDPTTYTKDCFYPSVDEE